MTQCPPLQPCMKPPLATAVDDTAAATQSRSLRELLFVVKEQAKQATRKKGLEESGAKQSQAALRSAPGIGGLEQMYGSRHSAHSTPSCCVRVSELRSAREVKFPLELKEQAESIHPRGCR